MAKNGATALVLRGDGINCDAETAWGLELAGFEVEPVHTTELLERPARLLDAQLFTIPGGFSFGDEIASGKVLAVKLKERVSETLFQFVERGSLVLGICNGFQVLVQLGFLPFARRDAPRVVSLTRNSGGKFINRWVDLLVDRKVNSPFFERLARIELPVRHGEGRLALAPEAGPEVGTLLCQHAVLRYREDVNGSFDRIAALTNSKGNVLGLMPHPEAFVRWSQHPNWMRRSLSSTRPGRGEAGADPASDPTEPFGLTILGNARKAVG